MNEDQMTLENFTTGRKRKKDFQPTCPTQIKFN